MTGGMLIFTLPGCGGDRLAALLSAHPVLRCFEEPFNPAVPDPTGRRVPKPTVAGVDAVLDGVWAGWPVIEHVWDPTGWPFPTHSALNGHVLLRASRVILLSRRNLLAVAVSAAAAEARRAGAAGVEAPGDPERVPLEVARVEWMLTQIRSSMRTHRRVLYTRDRPYVDVEAESIFGAGNSPAEGLDALKAVFAFLGRDVNDAGADFDRSWRGLDPATTEGFSASAWRALPNVDEIERELGSDENGWLLRDGTA